MPLASPGFRVNVSGETYAKANCILYIAFHPNFRTRDYMSLVDVGRGSKVGQLRISDGYEAN